MPTQTKTFRVFVSSTFADWEVERDALQARVWPELERMCAEKACRFQAIDLRWGLSEEAVRSARLLELCLIEIERCKRVSPRPNFVIFVGDRYGYCPVPESIVDSEFQTVLTQLSPDERKFLIGEKGWYRLDENTVVPSSEVECGIWRLQGWIGRLKSWPEWQAVEDRLRNLFAKASPLLSQHQRLKYHMSVTQQEFQRATVEAEDSREHVLAFVRTLQAIPDVAQDVEARRYLDCVPSTEHWNKDAQAADRSAHFKAEVHFAEDQSVHRVYDYPLDWERRISREYLDKFCEGVYQGLKDIIAPQLVDTQSLDSGNQDIRMQEEFLVERSRYFTGRAGELDEIASYLRQPDNQTLLLTGEPGSGKSSLMARALTLAREQTPDPKFIYKFCGATAVSGDEVSLLRLLCANLGWDLPPKNKSDDYEELVTAFRAALNQAAATTGVILFLDALDQLAGPRGERPVLNWISAHTPANVAFVVSCQSKAIPAHLARCRRIMLEPLPAPDAWRLVRQRLDLAYHRLQPTQEALVRERLADCGLPLYATLVAEAASRWTSYETSLSLPSDLSGILESLIEQLSAPERHGAILVARALGYLRNSRDGLSETELVGLLSADDDVWEDFIARSRQSPPERRLPMAIWSRLYLDLSTYLREVDSEHGRLLRFYHGSVAKVCADKLLPGAEDRRKLHQRMADYFQNRQPESDPRRLILLPWHLFHMEAWEPLCRVLGSEALRRSLWITWDQRHEDFVRYWKTIEKESSFRASDIYREVLASNLPASFDMELVLKLMIELGHDDQALECLERMIHMCQVLDNVSDYCQYLVMKASILQKRGDFDAAMAVLKEEEAVKRKKYNREGVLDRMAGLGASPEELSQMASLFNTDPDLNLIPSLGREANLLAEQGDLEGALALHVKVEEIYARNHDNAGLGRCLFYQARIHKHLTNFTKADQLLGRSITLLRDAGDSATLAGALNAHAEIYHSIKDYPDVVILLEEAAQIEKSLGLKDQMRTSLGRLGETLVSLGEPQRAINIFMELKQSFQEDGDEAGARMCDQALLRVISPIDSGLGVNPDEAEAMDLFQRGLEQFEKEKWSEAIPLFARAETLFRKVGNRKFARESLNRRSVAMRGMGENPTDEMIQTEISDMIFMMTGKDVSLNQRPPNS